MDGPRFPLPKRPTYFSHQVKATCDQEDAAFGRLLQRLIQSAFEVGMSGARNTGPGGALSDQQGGHRSEEVDRSRVAPPDPPDERFEKRGAIVPTEHPHKEHNGEAGELLIESAP